MKMNFNLSSTARITVKLIGVNEKFVKSLQKVCWGADSMDRREGKCCCFTRNFLEIPDLASNALCRSSTLILNVACLLKPFQKLVNGLHLVILRRKLLVLVQRCAGLV